MRVNVRFISSWEAITVQGGWWNDGFFEVEWCNHGGAVEEEFTETSWNYSREDVDEYRYKALVCDKCEMVDSGMGWEFND